MGRTMDALPPIGPSLGPFILRETLGEGGVAAVFRAEDTRDGSQVALKWLTLPIPSQRRRLHLEGRILSEVRHPNLVEVHEVREHDGLPVLVMDLVPGPTLDHLRGQALPLARLERLARGLMNGIEALHDAGWLHRDLKPANVLLDPRGRHEVPRIADLGIARPLHRDDPIHTRPGSVMGTPAFMAPEQVYDAASADARSDLWSLGCVLYQLATGDPPFQHASSFATMHAVVHRPHVPLSHHRPDLPARIVTAVDACLAKDPEARPASVDALRDLWEAVTTPQWARPQRRPRTPTHLDALVPTRRAA